MDTIMKRGKTLLVCSGKGGTGKSMVSANLGATLSLRGYKTLILDMDAGLRNIDLYLGLENKIVYDVYDVAKQVCDISYATVKDSNFKGLHYLASGPEGFVSRISSAEYARLFDILTREFDYVIVDTVAGLSLDFCRNIPSPKYAVIIACPDIATVRSGEGLRWSLRKVGFTDIFLLINRAYVKLLKSKYAMPVRQVNERINERLIGIIREDINVRISTNMGVPIVTNREGEITADFERIGDRILSLTNTVEDSDTDLNALMNMFGIL